MRKILFRGKTLDGFWVRGDLIRTSPCECHIVTADLDDYNNITFSFEDFVDCKTVGQYTGLIDKNGKGIFEGDIVRYQRGIDRFELMIVVWNEGTASLVLAYSKDMNYYETLMNTKYYCEVIGNIHDNPELLE